MIEITILTTMSYTIYDGVKFMWIPLNYVDFIPYIVALISNVVGPT